jgi:hypothetical protein
MHDHNHFKKGIERVKVSPKSSVGSEQHDVIDVGVDSEETAIFSAIKASNDEEATLLGNYFL